jgi:hypothetical protein
MKLPYCTGTVIWEALTSKLQKRRELLVKPCIEGYPPYSTTLKRVIL